MGLFGGGGSAPSAPKRSALTSADLMALIDSYKAREGADLSRRFGLEQQWAPKFAGLQDKMALKSADRFAGGNLDNLNKYGSRYVQTQDFLRRSADPVGARLRDSVGATIEADLNLGGRLDADEIRNINESVAASQTATGNTRGTAAELTPLLETAAASRARKGERLGAAANFAQGQTNAIANLTNQSATGQLVPFMPQNRGLVTDPSSGLDFLGAYQGFRGQDMSFDSSLFGQQSQNAANADQDNPWMEAFGVLAGAGTSIATRGTSKAV